MIDNVNDSKKAFIAWTIVCAILVAALYFLGQFDKENLGIVNEWSKDLKPFIPRNTTRFIIRKILPAFLGTFLLGMTFKNGLLPPPYIHVPTEELHAFDPRSIFVLIKVEIIIVIDVIMFALSLIVGLLVGPIAYIYTLISGIVLSIKRKI